MPVNPPAPPEPKRVVAGRAIKNHIEPVLLGVGFILGAVVAVLAR